MAELKNYVEGQPIEPIEPRVYTTIEEQAELKAYRDFGTLHQLRVLCDRYHELINRPTEAEIRNKAISEFAEQISLKISESLIWGMLPVNCRNGVSDEITDYVIDTVREIAEQLKGE